MRTMFVAALLVVAVSEAADPPSTKTPNEIVLEKVRALPDGGGYNWTGGNTGVPHEIRFKDSLILSNGKDGTYCCGVTFAVVVDTANDLHMLDGLAATDVKAMQKRWYGVPKEAQELQCVMALEKAGIGAAVTPDEAQAGDFMQFYREKGGHSVVFLNWVVEDGQRVGFNYRSSQQSTNGIGDRIEYFSDVDGKGGKVDRKRIYFGRLGKKPDAKD